MHETNEVAIIFTYFFPISARYKGRFWAPSLITMIKHALDVAFNFQIFWICFRSQRQIILDHSDELVQLVIIYRCIYIALFPAKIVQ